VDADDDAAAAAAAAVDDGADVDADDAVVVAEDCLLGASLEVLQMATYPYVNDDVVAAVAGGAVEDDAVDADDVALLLFAKLPLKKLSFHCM